MLHEKIRSVAEALNEHKDRVPENDGDTWKLLHNAACNLDALASSAEQLEAQLVPGPEKVGTVISSEGVLQ